MIEREIKFVCDVCRKTEIFPIGGHIRLDTVAIEWHMPGQWSIVRGRLICDEHEITVVEETRNG